MKLILQKSAQAVPAAKLLKLAGYIYIIDRKYGKDSYSRPLGRYHYPRFHVYIDDATNYLTINLHLDQKQAIYVGVKRHSGEYDGPAVEGEMARLQTMAIASGYFYDRSVKLNKEAVVQAKPVKTPQSTIGAGDYRLAADKYQVKKSWWKKLFS